MHLLRIAPIALVSLCSCWTPQHAERVWQGHVLAQSRLDPGAVDPVGAALVPELAPREDAVPKPGDVVVYSIDVESPSRSYRRYLRFTVEDSELLTIRTVTIMQSAPTGEKRSTRYPSRMLPVRVELFDEAGEPIAESAPEAAVELLARGFTESCKVYLERDNRFETIEEMFDATLLDGPALFSIGFMLQNDDTLYDLALDLIDTSVVLSAIWNFGIKFSIEPRYEDAERVERDVVTGLPGYRFPVQFSVNGNPALRIAATVVEPFAPLGITAGITRVEGFRPSDDRYRVKVRLVAPREARRGPGQGPGRRAR